MTKKLRRKKARVFPFPRGEGLAGSYVSSRVWRHSFKRAYLSLSKLERAGFSSARILKEVLLDIDGLISNGEIEEQQIAQIVQLLQIAHKSSRLRRFLRTRDTENLKLTCNILKRAVSDLERIVGKLKAINFRSEAETELVRKQLLQVILSILTAERQALRRAR